MLHVAKKQCQNEPNDYNELVLNQSKFLRRAYLKIAYIYTVKLFMNINIQAGQWQKF